MQLTIGRQAFLDIMAEGQRDIGSAIQPTPAGLWGLPPAILKILPGYGPDVAQNRKQAQEIMRRLGYGHDEVREALESGRADLVSFGRPFIGNPDLVRRMRDGAPLVDAPQETYYGGNEQGYSDWPTLADPLATDR